MKRIFVISPNHRTTGGVELLHQFVDQANRLGANANIVYFPFNRPHEQPQAYRKYSAPQARLTDCNTQDAVVIVPETLTHLIPKLTKATVAIWWLSVDNYFGSQKLRFLAANRLWPFTHWRPSTKQKIFHLSQSQYAVDFLKGNSIPQCSLMTDYLNEDFVNAAGCMDLSRKDRLVAFNPAKGLERTMAVLKHLPDDIETVALQGLTRDGMVAVLAKAKVYIDFGNHPGKDRIPREAALMNCCVVTNKRGSAANEIDVPLLPMYKVSDTETDYEKSAAVMIASVVNSYEDHLDHFEHYRKSICQERSAFEHQVNCFLVEKCS
jgi:hypothetical protein